jgi:hypothetical protein
MDGKKTPER